MEKEHHKFIFKYEVFLKILIDGWDETMELLLKREECKNLKQEVFNQISVEFLIFYLYYFDTVLVRVIPEEDKYNIAVEAIRLELARKLAERDTSFINTNEKINNIRMDSFERIDFIKKYGLFVYYSNMFKPRFEWYVTYKYFTMGEKNGELIEDSKTNAHAAFYKKVTQLIKGDPEHLFKIIVGELSFKRLGKYEKELALKGISVWAKNLEVKVIRDIREAI